MIRTMRIFGIRLEGRRPGGRSGRSEAGLYGAVGGAVAATAAAGSLAIDPHDPWYDSLAKPAWQPPGWAFPVVWTPLYASIVWAGGHSLLRAVGGERKQLTAALAANLALNTAFGWAFFKARNPAMGLGVTLALSASCWDLVRRSARVDRAAAAALVPYAAWSTFAAALSAEIRRLNHHQG